MKRFVLIAALAIALFVVGCSAAEEDAADSAPVAAEDVAATDAGGEPEAQDPADLPYESDANWWLTYGMALEYGNDAAAMLDAGTVTGDSVTEDGATVDHNVGMTLADGTEIASFILVNEWERQADFNLGVWGMVGDPISSAVIAEPDGTQALATDAIALEMLRALGATDEVMDSTVAARTVESQEWDLIGGSASLVRYSYGDDENWAYVVYDAEGALLASRARIDL